MLFKELPDSYLSRYWKDIYRRTERSLAWILISIGLMIIIGFSAYMGLSRFYADPDISVELKVGVSLALSAGIIMIVSIARKRIFARKFEMYEKDDNGNLR